MAFYNDDDEWEKAEMKLASMRIADNNREWATSSQSTNQGIAPPLYNPSGTVSSSGIRGSSNQSSSSQMGGDLGGISALLAQYLATLDTSMIPHPVPISGNYNLLCFSLLEHGFSFIFIHF